MTDALRNYCETAGLSEVEFVLQGFDGLFDAWRGKRIVLHGAREYARAILERFGSRYGFEAVVLAEADDGADFEGCAVWSHERLMAERPDLVILTERVRHAEAVYQQIGDACRKQGIALFDMYGLDWLAVHDLIDAQTVQTMNGWLDIAAPYDVVSLEAPDLLLVGKLGGSGAMVAQPRTRTLVERLIDQGKRVLFIGRGPYSEEQLKQALVDERLVPDVAALAGTFYMRTGEDGCWRTIRADYPDARILHIGYGIPKECILPRYYGVDTYRMVSGGIAAGVARSRARERMVAEALDPRLLQKRIAEAIGSCSVVSFDVFDTLLVRSVARPEDVFDIVAHKAAERGMAADGYPAARRAAQYSPLSPTIEGIYAKVQELLGLSDDCCDALRALELEAEYEVVSAREPVCRVFREALARGKKVYLVSDMYYPAPVLADLLEANGIFGYEELIVSCDHGAMKQQGLLRYLLASGCAPCDAVHIGDSIEFDIEPACDLGIRAILVPSVRSLTASAGIDFERMRAEEPTALAEAVAEATRVFGDPFAERDMAAVAVEPSAAKRGSDPFAERGIVHVVAHDGRFPAALRQALLRWYPFEAGSRALFVGSDWEAFAPYLEARFATVDRRLVAEVRYDCIIALDILEDAGCLTAICRRFFDALSPDGVLLIGFRNRFGVRYLCGATDNAVKSPFQTLGPTEGGRAAWGRQEMARLLESAGFCGIRTYQVMPDASFAQAVYTDDFVPTSGIGDRVMPFDAYGSSLVASERDLYDAVTEEGMLGHVADYFIQECRKPGFKPPARQVVHASLSLDRAAENAFVTTLFSDGTAVKNEADPAGRRTLEALCANDCALRARGIATVEQRLGEDGMRMPVVHEPALLAYLGSLLPDDPDAFIGVFSQLRDTIMQSSDLGQIDEREAQELWGCSAGDLGLILQRGFIDMIPYNAFWIDGRPVFFDQEFALDDCPVNYIMYRAIHYTWIHLPQAEESIPLARMKRLFGLDWAWDAFEKREAAFIRWNRNLDAYSQIHGWAHVDRGLISERIRALSDMREKPLDEKPYEVGLLMGVFDLFHVGHLRLVRRAKARCRYLRVGVLGDALTLQMKGIVPTIPLEQRMEIIGALAEVDEVVAIEDTTSRIDEWHRRSFDCFFSGDDYAGDDAWAQERRDLRALGADIEFFPYTEEQSSSGIRGKLAGGNDSAAL